MSDMYIDDDNHSYLKANITKRARDRNGATDARRDHALPRRVRRDEST